MGMNLKESAFPGGYEHGVFLTVGQVLGQMSCVAGQAMVLQHDFGARLSGLDSSEFPHIGFHGKGLPLERKHEQETWNCGPANAEEGTAHNPDNGSKTDGRKESKNAVL